MEVRDRAHGAFRLADLRYRARSISYFDQIVAQTSFTDASATLAAANLRVATDRVSLFKALGGRWEDGGARIASEGNAQGNNILGKAK